MQYKRHGQYNADKMCGIQCCLKAFKRLAEAQKERETWLSLYTLASLYEYVQLSYLVVFLRPDVAGVATQFRFGCDLLQNRKLLWQGSLESGQQGRCYLHESFKLE